MGVEQSNITTLGDSPIVLLPEAVIDLPTERSKLASVSDMKQCETCNGVGKIPNFVSESITKKCNKCNGTGWKIKTCNRCTKGLNEKGKVCQVCNGTGIYVYRKTYRFDGIKCDLCDGKGDIKTTINTKKIKSYRKCNTCDGSGKTKIIFSNPVLNKSSKLMLLRDKLPTG